MSVRGMRPGERLAPLGLDGERQKLSDFFTNHKLPQRARAGWPLVIAGEEPVWVVGLRTSEPAKIDPATEKVIHLELIRTGNPSESG